MTPDHMNALFELVGSFLTWMNAWCLYQEKQTKGVYWPTAAFFSVWGMWNLFYYPSLGQYWSFYAGILLVSGNVAWVWLAVKYNYFDKAESA